ncbi:lytic polysaccharide monooxygenase [Streptomyces sp. ACA25]|uniref:lytic polysaccharide monooxygenase auxiliary activity family 9 protein n=1 Tax=Streptomyces sp. ACA25 TaxID=3022596 RepID=UPI0023077421|nr:lytic polysaccharide monooxygenase [Streptomyces sp. ACA25]MDB1087996.1 lytic polysaccharide monooxygenase [Streptomyces sp. ACA25]
MNRHEQERRSRSWLLRAAAVLSAGLVSVVPWAEPAAAHGSTVDPASRNYGCWQRWGHDFQNPAMANQDPMCWQAWQSDTNAMWNWNGLYRDGVGGDHQGVIPNGQLCSAGHTEGGRYAAMDAVGDWQATETGTDFTLRLHDQAMHGADYIDVYVTRQGFNPLHQALGWGDLELAGQSGRILPGEGEVSDDPNLNGRTMTVDVNAAGRSGRHIVYTIWKASHADQVYYLCSDVDFR